MDALPVAARGQNLGNIVKQYELFVSDIDHGEASV
jgi:hypothetical protein